MARSYAQITTSMWRPDGQFRTLTGAAQRAYLLLNTQPDISAAGVLPLTVKRWAAMASDTTAAALVQSLAELHGRGYIVMDDDTEEVLVRAFIKWDGGVTNSKRLPVVLAAVADVASPALAAALTEELAKLGVLNTPVDAPPDALSNGTTALNRVVVNNHNPQPATLNPQPMTGWDAFWRAYPRHVAVAAAKVAYAKRIKAGADPDLVLAGARRYAEWVHGRDPQFTKHPATWLNQECWLDEPAPAPASPGAVAAARRAADPWAAAR